MGQLRPGWTKRRESGATLVEAALAFPIMVLIVIAILELGMAFKDYLTVSYLSREGARIGAMAGDDPDADCAILRGIEQLATAGTLGRIDSVEIFQASETTGQPVAGHVNTAIYLGGDPPKCTPGGAPDDTWRIVSTGWAPTDRNVSVGPGNRPDIVGVRIRLNSSWITGFPPFRGAFTIDERTITRIEPEAFHPAP